MLKLGTSKLRTSENGRIHCFGSDSKTRRKIEQQINSIIQDTQVHQFGLHTFLCTKMQVRFDSFDDAAKKNEFENSSCVHASRVHFHIPHKFLKGEQFLHILLRMLVLFQH